MRRFFHHHGLAVACVIAPLLFGLWGNYLVVAWFLDAGQVASIKIDYRLRDQPDARPASSSETPPKAAPDPAVARIDLVARHFSGIVNFALTTSVLWFIAAGAFATSFVFVSRYAGWRVAALVAVICVAVSVVQAVLIVHSEHRRVLVMTILRLAEAHVALKDLPMVDRVRDAIAINVVVGISAVFMLLGTFYVAAIRRSGGAGLEDLKDRLVAIRIALVLTSALLVIEVLFSRALGDWPLSLLVDDQKSALTPAANALAQIWGTTGTIAAIGVAAPALVSWHLDRAAYRRCHQGEGAETPKDGLEIAPLSTATSLLAVIAPVVASPVLDIVKSLLGAASGR
jgi:hypothetical protein